VDRQINLMDLLRLYMRRWWYIVIAMIVGGLLSGMFTKFFITPMYTSAGSLYTENSTDIVSQNATDINLSTVTVRRELVTTYAEVLTSNIFLKKVANESGLGYDHSQLLSMISMTDKNDTEILVVSVTTNNPDHAYIIAQKIMDLAPGQVSEVVEGGNVKKLDEPERPTKPSSPNTVRNIEIGVFIGLLLSLIIIFAVEMLDNKVKDAEALSETFKYPVLGEVPFFTTNVKKEDKKKKDSKEKEKEKEKK